jgi:hypothetical protein
MWLALAGIPIAAAGFGGAQANHWHHTDDIVFGSVGVAPYLAAPLFGVRARRRRRRSS